MKGSDFVQADNTVEDKSLLKWQTISFISRMMAMGFGIIQSVIIVRILSVAEYGLVSIVTSVGAAFGVYQHLGLASGSTREIATVKDPKQIFKIFFTSTIIRYIISGPLALTLYFLAPYIATHIYGQPELIFLLRLYAIVMIAQGLQSIFNSVISGMERFKRLFIYQVFIAGCSLIIYIPLIYFYKVTGFFYALLIFNILSSSILGFLALKPISSSFVFPTKAEFKVLFKEILSISLGIFAVKIIYTYWNKIGPLVLGVSLSPEQVGIFSFALLYSGKLMSISDSITDVNLPVLSRKFKENFEEFKHIFSSNFDKIFAFILFVGGSAIYWVGELAYLVIDKTKYEASYHLILPIIFAFIFYSVINVVKSSILIPAKFIKEMIVSFVLLIGITVLSYVSLLKITDPLNAMAYGMAIGSFTSMMFIASISVIKIKYNFFNKSHLFLFIFVILLSTLEVEMFSKLKLYCYVGFVFTYYKLIMYFNYLNYEQIGSLFLDIKKKFTK
ncbi:oligosaccharide flippase family protein [candidate division WWE3 bacterium]|nr:oligosaccharide flippase family protein [candidate division WWE3 bacterium]